MSSSLKGASVSQLIRLSEEYPREFSEENADYWFDFFDVLEKKKLLTDGLRVAAQAADHTHDSFSWSMGPFISRMERDTILRTVHEFYSQLRDGVFTAVLESVLIFAAEPDTRRAVRQDYMEHLSRIRPESRRGIDLQFEEQVDQFKREWLRGWVEDYRSSVSYFTRCSLRDFGVNSVENTVIWAYGYPIRHIQSTKSFDRMIKAIYKETQDYFAEREQPLTLYHGTTFRYSQSSVVESWTSNLEVAERYDGYQVYERKVSPESVLITYEVAGIQNNAYSGSALTKFREDEEHIVLGGGIDETER